MNKAQQALTLLSTIAIVVGGCQPIDGTSDTTDSGPCIPKTCEEVGWVCGTIEGGCNALVSCGKCDSGYKCKLGKCEKVCVPDCAGKCGGSDGCQGVCADTCALTGQTCSDQTETCTGECVPRTCHSMNKECGEWDDWCGTTAICGECLPGSNCNNGICSAIPGDGLGVICESNAAICREPFPECLDLISAARFCSKACSGDGQCGTGNCCVPVNDAAWCIPSDSEFMCTNPVGTEACFDGETCLPSPVGGCLFCFPEGEKTVGQECEGFNSCIKGLICHKTGLEKAFTCKEICDPANINACLDGGLQRHCVADSSLGKFGYCKDGARSCSALKQADDCPNTHNCVVTDNKCSVFECLKAGTVISGLACTNQGDCARGLYCADNKCRPLCSMTSQCPANHECVAGCSSKIKYCMPTGGNACTPGAVASQCLPEQTCLPEDANCLKATCVQPGALTVGASCQTNTECASGLMCYMNRCKTVCSLEKVCPQSGLCTFICSYLDIGLCI